MQKYLTIILIILLYSCGVDSVTNPPIIDFHTDDQNFINDLASVNSMLDTETIENGITKIEVDTEGVKFFKIKKLYMGSMNLDSIPSSIGDLDSLTILMLNNNKFKFIPESICSIFENLDSLAVDNNEICNPSALPTCIKNNTTILFYDSQDCQITPDEEDWDFIDELITNNWGQDSLSIYREKFYNLTKWETFEETIDNQEFLRSRITEIRYNGCEIKEIPDGIAELEMLTRLELQNNQIVIIPDFIGSLLNLNYFTIYDNNISVIPASIGDLTNLEVFKISENSLDSIPPMIRNLKNLQKLWLNDNQLSTLPDSMCTILENPNLEIYIQNNLLCADSSNVCFKDLINNSTQPSDVCNP